MLITQLSKRGNKMDTNMHGIVVSELTNLIGGNVIWIQSFEDEPKETEALAKRFYGRGKLSVAETPVQVAHFSGPMYDEFIYKVKTIEVGEGAVFKNLRERFVSVQSHEEELGSGTVGITWTAEFLTDELKTHKHERRAVEIENEIAEQKEAETPSIIIPD